MSEPDRGRGPRWRPSVIVAVSLILLLGSKSLFAQAERPPPGTRVRVTTQGALRGPIVGTVLEWTADSLFIERGNRSALGLPLAALESLEISRGEKSEALTGALVGLAAGTAAAAGFLSVFCSDADTVCESDEIFRALAIIVPPPTALGALIGLAVREERWESVPLRIEAAPHGPDGWAVTLRWSF